MTDRIEKTIDIAAPVERVWRAITDHVEFGQWFRVRLDGPFVVGRSIGGQITNPGYEHIRWQADVVRMEPPGLFAFTWRPYAIDPEVDYSGEMPTLVEFRLHPIPKGTRLDLIESGFDAVPRARRDEAFRMNDNGWTRQMTNIKSHVEG